MNYTNTITKHIRKYPELKIIDASMLYKEKFRDISEQAYYQVLSRMTKSGELLRLSRSVYCIPKNSRFGTIPPSEENILELNLGLKMNKGVVIGYRLYNKYRLTTQISKKVEIYSNVNYQAIKRINNVIIHRVNIKFDEPTIRMIELLEVLDNYMKIEDLNTNSLIRFIENLVKFYDEKILHKLIESIGYKKSTLASLKNVLDYYKIENSVYKYLSSTSKYKALSMEELHEFTS